MAYPYEPHDKTTLSELVSLLFKNQAISRGVPWLPLARACGRCPDFDRQNDGRCNGKEAQARESVQHGGKSALLIEPGHEADRNTRCGKADEITHGIGARTPFLAGVFADHGVVDGDLAERAHHDADSSDDKRKVGEFGR